MQKAAVVDSLLLKEGLEEDILVTVAAHHTGAAGVEEDSLAVAVGSGIAADTEVVTSMIRVELRSLALL